MDFLEKDNWWWRGRRKIFLKILGKDFGKKKGRKILDVGCGTGIMLSHLARFGEVVGVDIAKEAIGFCQKKGLEKVYLGDAQKLPFGSKKFDLVTAFDTLEHVKDDKKALKEFYRVLQGGGMILLTVPAHPVIWSSHDDRNQHYRRYTKDDFRSKVLEAGFKIKRITYMNSLLFLPAFTFRFLTGVFNRSGVFKAHTDFHRMPWLINDILTWAFGGEAVILQNFNLPIGITLLIEAKK